MTAVFMNAWLLINIMGKKKTRINVAVQVRRLIGLYCRHRIYLIQSKVALRASHWHNWP